MKSIESCMVDDRIREATNFIIQAYKDGEETPIDQTDEGKYDAYRQRAVLTARQNEKCGWKAQLVMVLFVFCIIICHVFSFLFGSYAEQVASIGEAFVASSILTTLGIILGISLIYTDRKTQSERKNILAISSIIENMSFGAFIFNMTKFYPQGSQTDSESDDTPNNNGGGQGNTPEIMPEPAGSTT